MNTKSNKNPKEQGTQQSTLFDLGEPDPLQAASHRKLVGGTPRLNMADRIQVQFRAFAWNDLLPEDHQARIVWDYVESIDMGPLYKKISAVEGRPGRPPIDPKILLALWIYATLRGVGSARELDRRCNPEEGELPFQWICGDVRVNYHTLADFRTAHVEFLDDLLTNSVAVLLNENLVNMDRVAQDGMRVRASAGSSSFRRGETLERCIEEAKKQVETLKAELDSDSTAGSRRKRAARERAARERAERIKRASDQLPEIEAKKKAKDRDKARASTTDADARVMKMGDGGFRPAYNVQFATDTESQVITGVDVTNSGGDQGQMAPMVEQHEQRYQQTPKEMLVDGGFVKKEDIEEVSEPNGNTTVYSPVMQSKSDNRDPHTPRDDDSPVIAAWRKRMATDEAKLIYRERASTAECVNAIARNRGMQQFRVRGRPKVLAVVLLYALTHNIMRTAALRAATETKAA